ncbi:MAG: hypothetical protein PVF87_07435 [Acidimicrobiia bacterium]
MDDYQDPQEIEDVDSRLEPEAGPVQTRAGVPWGAILLLIWAVALIVFSVQNAESTTVEFLAWDWSMPVALLVMITALVTLFVTAIGAAVYRRRRRQRAEMKRALRSEDSP